MNRRHLFSLAIGIFAAPLSALASRKTEPVARTTEAERRQYRERILADGREYLERRRAGFIVIDSGLKPPVDVCAVIDTASKDYGIVYIR